MKSWLSSLLPARNVTDRRSRRRGTGVRRLAAAWEQLESRQMLAAVTWDGGAGTNNWFDAENWSTDSLPGAADDVTISSSSRVTFAGADSIVASLSTTALTINAGTLSVTGAFNLNAGQTLTVSTELNAAGAVNIDGASVIATSGGNILFNGATSYDNPSNRNTVLRATGAGSVLDLPKLASLEVSQGFWDVAVEARSGGVVNLPLITQVVDSTIHIEAHGADSAVNMPLLTSFGGHGTYGGEIEVSDEGHVNAPLLTSLSDTVLTIGATGSFSTSQITSITNGNLYVREAGVDFSSLTDIDGSGVIVDAPGVALSLPGVTAYDNRDNARKFLRAQGAGTSLSFPAMSSLEVTQGFWDVIVDARSGGVVSLPLITQVVDSTIHIEAHGADSAVNLPLLTSFGGHGTYGGEIEVSDEGHVNAPLLTSLSDTVLTIGATGNFPTSHMTSITNGNLYVRKAGVDFSSLTDIDGSGVIVDAAGVALSLPGVTAYDNRDNARKFLRAQGAGTSLSFPAMSTLGVTQGFWDVIVDARDGGVVNLPLITQVVDSTIHIEALGADSVVNLPLLTSFSAHGTYGGEIEVSDEGHVNAPLLTSLSDTVLTIGATGSFSTSQITSITNGNLYVREAGVDFSSLTDIDGSGVIVDAPGVALSLPGVTVYDNRDNARKFYEHREQAHLCPFRPCRASK